MTYYVTSYHLNELISEIMKGTIELHRRSKNTLCFDGDACVADQEVCDFILSTPHFSEELKEFLYTRDDSVFINATKEWFNDFLSKPYPWSESDEWVIYDVQFICDPALNRSPEREEPDLSPHNRAIFYCQRFS